MSSGNIIPIAVHSQVTVIHDQDNGTDDEEDDKLFKTADPSERLPHLKLSLNNNLPVSSYSNLPTPELFTIKIQKLTRTSWLHSALPDWMMKSHIGLPHRAVHLIMQWRVIMILLEVLHHITANQSLARKPALQTGSSGSDLLQYKNAFTYLQQDNGGADKLNTA